MDKFEFFLKLVVTIFATVLFLGLGAGVLYLSPSGAGSADMDNVGEEGIAAFEAGNRTGVDELPVPPYTSMVHQEETEQANIRMYESRMGPEGLVRFYAEELPSRGWERGRRMPDDVLSQRQEFGSGGEVLYFTAGRRVCIINIEEKDSYRTRVSLVKNRR